MDLEKDQMYRKRDKDWLTRSQASRTDEGSTTN
nr:MAG TPA: hypothetical protein [Caudoviricetes sp.]